MAQDVRIFGIIEENLVLDESLHKGKILSFLT
jgi:hypothetical protein